MAQRISIGLHASPPLALRVSEDELGKLRSALTGEGWHEIASEDGQVTLALEHVLYLRVDKEESRVGFGLSGG